MSNEPLLTKPNGSPNGGREEYTDEQYQKWLDEMAPYLKMASTIYYACDRAGIITHYYSIMRKYKLGDWFCIKVDAYRREIGEVANNATVRLMTQIDTKIKQQIPLTREETGFMQWFAEKHRTAQPFFVTRTETVAKDDREVGKILDVLEGTDYDEVGRQAKKQVVALNPPVQNTGQVGQPSDAKPELPATVTPSGTGSPQV